MGQADRTIALLSSLTPKYAEIVSILSSSRVTLTLGSDFAERSQAQLLFSFTLNLLARLYPVVQNIRVTLPESVPFQASLPRWKAQTLYEHAKLFLKKLDPPLTWSIEKNKNIVSSGLILSIDSPILPNNRQTIFVGSDGWNASVSTNSPMVTSDQVNAVGAFSAACLGVSEVWKNILYPYRHLTRSTPIKPLNSDLTFSAFTYQTGKDQPNPIIPSSIDIHRLTMVGLGAGGGATAFTLASLGELVGSITLIEPDELLDHNQNRYAYSDFSDVTTHRLKVRVVEDMFSKFQGLRVHSYSKPYNEVAKNLTKEDFRYVVATVHSREARRELQYETPMILWDAAASEQGDFFVWRLVLGQTECMWCKHPPGNQDPEYQKAEQLVNLLGLDLETWLSKIRNNEYFADDEVNSIVAHVKDSVISFDLPQKSQRFSDWEASQCGQLPLPEIDEGIPIPFSPIMAGVLLAGEVIKEHYFPHAVLDSYYWNTLVGQFLRRSRPHRRLPRQECTFCKDNNYIEQYIRRWQ